MNIEHVTERFALLASLDSNELPRWGTLVRDACAYVQAHCTVKDPDAEQTARLEALAAAYALKLYGMYADEGITQFVAGDVRLTSSAGTGKKANSLWDELLRSNADLIHTGGFLFGRVIT